MGRSLVLGVGLLAIGAVGAASGSLAGPNVAATPIGGPAASPTAATPLAVVPTFTPTPTRTPTIAPTATTVGDAACVGWADWSAQSAPRLTEAARLLGGLLGPNEEMLSPSAHVLFDASARIAASKAAQQARNPPAAVQSLNDKSVNALDEWTQALQDAGEIKGPVNPQVLAVLPAELNTVVVAGAHEAREAVGVLNTFNRRCGDRTAWFAPTNPWLAV